MFFDNRLDRFSTETKKQKQKQITNTVNIISKVIMDAIFNNNNDYIELIVSIRSFCIREMAKSKKKGKIANIHRR
ncbi:hypothetical protein DERP_009261 [Dermatophagoides pteronyssinus]|uniref:Uncharacterized protein n=1 Tax=Dermatophagoides pteronyssinus TaxID=6956 RepID=A0ABQ8ITC6_DERPT|nr:hypothetical protein DERP_009261 [Dermatophagoides pteronyssinus]